MNLFKENITNWSDWGRVFQSIPAFEELVKYILQKENLQYERIENLTPGTNAVFKVKDNVIKIFAPPESGIDQSEDLKTELFAVKRANSLGISTPKLITDGFIKDKYVFKYMIMEYIYGKEFIDIMKSMTNEEKVEFGRNLRIITEKMNTPCEPFNDIDVIEDKMRYKRWDKYPKSFKKERLEYIKSYDYGEKVFVHGDLCADNMIVTSDGDIYIIDFADAVLAPVIYEHTLVAFMFEFDQFFLEGYFGSIKREEFIDMCFNGLLIHDFGGDIVQENFGNVDKFTSLKVLKDCLSSSLPI